MTFLFYACCLIQFLGTIHCQIPGIPKIEPGTKMPLLDNKTSEVHLSLSRSDIPTLITPTQCKINWQHEEKIQMINDNGVATMMMSSPNPPVCEGAMTTKPMTVYSCQIRCDKPYVIDGKRPDGITIKCCSSNGNMEIARKSNNPDSAWCGDYVTAIQNKNNTMAEELKMAIRNIQNPGQSVEVKSFAVLRSMLKNMSCKEGWAWTAYSEEMRSHRMMVCNSSTLAYSMADMIDMCSSKNEVGMRAMDMPPPQAHEPNGTVKYFNDLIDNMFEIPNGIPNMV